MKNYRGKQFSLTFYTPLLAVTIKKLMKNTENLKKIHLVSGILSLLVPGILWHKGLVESVHVLLCSVHSIRQTMTLFLSPSSFAAFRTCENASCYDYWSVTSAGSYRVRQESSCQVVATAAKGPELTWTPCARITKSCSYLFLNNLAALEFKWSIFFHLFIN